MVENITNWLIANEDSLISNVIVTSFFIIGARLWIFKNKIPNFVKILLNIEAIKYFVFIVLYILPLVIIISMIIAKINLNTFKNLAFFILICLTLVYNILMSHIIILYKMIGELATISSEKLTKIDETFTTVYDHTEKLRIRNNLK